MGAKSIVSFLTCVKLWTLEFLVFTRDARDPINKPIMFRILELNTEVDVVTSSTFI